VDLAGRILRVDHVQNYKQKELVDGKWVDRETERLNAKPGLIEGEQAEDSDASADSAGSIDQEDPMRDYLIEQKREGKKKSKSKKHADETPEERRARKEKKRQKKLLKEGKHKDTGRITDRDRHSSHDKDRRDEARSRPRSHSPDTRPRERRDRSPPPRDRRSRSPHRRHESDRRDDDRLGDDS